VVPWSVQKHCITLITMITGSIIQANRNLGRFVMIMKIITKVMQNEISPDSRRVSDLKLLHPRWFVPYGATATRHVACGGPTHHHSSSATKCVREDTSNYGAVGGNKHNWLIDRRLWDLMNQCSAVQCSVLKQGSKAVLLPVGIGPLREPYGGARSAQKL
jgi:hypothetical protein